MITYELSVGCGYVGATHEDTITVEELGFTDEEWLKLTEDEQDNELSDAWQDWSNNFIDGGWELIE